MDNVTAPKDLARLARSTERALARCEASLQRMQTIPRWKPDPELVKKYNLIEFV